MTTEHWLIGCIAAVALAALILAGWAWWREMRARSIITTAFVDILASLRHDDEEIVALRSSVAALKEWRAQCEKNTEAAGKATDAAEALLERSCERCQWWPENCKDNPETPAVRADPSFCARGHYTDGTRHKVCGDSFTPMEGKT